MQEEIKNEIKNLWLSDDCAKSSCANCAEKKVLSQTIHLCYCHCHAKSAFKNEFATAGTAGTSRFRWW